MDVKKMLLARVDVKGIVEDVVGQVVKPKLEELVAKSETKIDDAVLQVLWPMLDEAVKKAIEELMEKHA